MRKILLPLTVVLALALGLSACDAQLSSVAAHVDGTTISTSRLNATLNAIGADADYRCVLNSSSSATEAGAGPGTDSSSFVASILTTLVEQKVLAHELSAMHLSVSGFADKVGAEALESELSPAQGSSCTASGAQVYKGLQPGFRTFLSTLQADQGVLLAHEAGVALTRAGVAHYGAEHAAATSLDCISAIEVASKSLADSVSSQLKAGASFAALAKKDSIDTSSAASGGALGCVLPSELTAPLGPAVEALSPDTDSAPISFDSEWVLFRLTGRKPAPDDQVANLILEAESTKDSTLVVDALGHATVTVDPAYGTWAKASGVMQVRPSTGPASKLLVNPKAVSPSASTTSSSLG